MPKQLKTVADLMNVTDDSYRHELVAGVIVAEPLPRHRHDRARWRVERVIRAHLEAANIGEVFGGAGYLLARDPDTVRGPDLSFVSSERLAGFDDTAFFPGAPDLSVEILSPLNRPGEMHAKVADYLAAGARMVWVLDAEKRTITTYRSLLSPRTLQSGETLDGEDVLPGLSIPIDAIFGG